MNTGTPMDKKEQFLHLLDAQRNNYARALPGRVEDMERRWRALASGIRCDGDAEELGRAAHALRGSGSTFGFPEISRNAGLVEQLLQGLPQGRPSRRRAARVAAALDSLRLALPGAEA